jgi:hypothetical protein
MGGGKPAGRRDEGGEARKDRTVMEMELRRWECPRESGI